MYFTCKSTPSSFGVFVIILKKIIGCSNCSIVEKNKIENKIIRSAYISKLRSLYFVEQYSLYNRIEVKMESVVQYIMTLSSRASRENFFVRPPSGKSILAGFVRVANLPRIYAANPVGESSKAAPKISMS